MDAEALNRYLEAGIFSPLDRHFARFIERIAEKSDPSAVLAAALVSRAQREGHICADLSELAGSALEIDSEDEGPPPPCPDLQPWLAALNKCKAVGAPGEYTPLVLDSANRLYLHRYWEYQDRLAARIRRRVCADPPEVDRNLLRDGLKRLFPQKNNEPVDWQQVAAYTAVTHRFCVISGGPGTGKTTTVARILSLLYEQAGARRLRIALTAPTGKAAARLQEAIQGKTEDTESGSDTPEKSNLAKEKELNASTIHRLLGVIHGSPFFRYNADNPLPVDVVVVDEASMVDLALMSKLVQALPDSARLILLGDKDQLSSVEAGAVLGDICGTEAVDAFTPAFCEDLKQAVGSTLTCPRIDSNQPEICDCIVQLQRNYRYDENSAIGPLSIAVNQGNPEAAVKILHSDTTGTLHHHRLPDFRDLIREMQAVVIDRFRPYLRQLKEPAQVLKQFEQFRILCALRRGPFGALALNRIIEEILRAAKLIPSGGTWYPGRPVLITENDYGQRLFNGDIGITLPDKDKGDGLRVFFPEGVHKPPRSINPLRLPGHETVYAMTVHKSQGSEFNHVLLLLPDRESPVLTRELLYTGITRAKHSVEIWGPDSVFKNAVKKSIRRTSGLRNALWGETAHRED
ncbi:MAG: exodeoxyribonuclease V subunit alpha [Thermodesulfobacteriota bacterium]